MGRGEGGEDAEGGGEGGRRCVGGGEGRGEEESGLRWFERGGAVPAATVSSPRGVGRAAVQSAWSPFPKIRALPRSPVEIHNAVAG